MKILNRIIFGVLLIAILIACSKSADEVTPPVTNELTYSNLVDDTSREEVFATMSDAGFSAEQLDTLSKDIDFFNHTVDETGLTTNGFQTINNLTPEYDVVKMMELWETNSPEFMGYNCRITSYDLMRDKLTIGKIDTEHVDYLAFDQFAIETSPRELFTHEEYEKFQTLFAYIPTELTKDVNTHVKHIQSDWRKKEIEFSKSDKVSMISVFFHEEDGYLFIGHMGLLFPTENNELLFLEKLSFQEPYQAIKFANRTELNDYLMTKYDLSWDQPTAAPFILENDQLLDGYRQLPKSQE